MGQPAIDFTYLIKQAMMAAQEVETVTGEIIADNGAVIGETAVATIQAGNGAATETSLAAQTATSGTLATYTTGVCYAAFDVGLVGAALAPALGIVAGVGLYNLAPEFWTDVSNALVAAGQTVGGKVIGYFDGDNVYFSKDTIEIFKQKLVDIDYFNREESVISSDTQLPTWAQGYKLPSSGPGFMFIWRGNKDIYYDLGSVWSTLVRGCYIALGTHFYQVFASASLFKLSTFWPNGQEWGHDAVTAISDQIYGKTVYHVWGDMGLISSLTNITPPLVTIPSNVSLQEAYNAIAYILVYGSDEIKTDNPLQPGATYPTDNPFDTTFPGWTKRPWSTELPDPSSLPEIYPIKIPGIGTDPNPDQEGAQDPEPEPAPEVVPIIIPSLPIPTPVTDPTPITPPTPDPDPRPDPEAETEPEPEPKPDPETPPDPVDPNPDPTPTPIIPIPPLPATVSSSKLFTVYNPDQSALNGLGGYLWDSSIIASIRDIWQNPLDGIISLIQIYATPPTSGNQHIILGFLDSGVSANVVSNQFTTLDCGSVTIPENKGNATDYSPYTSLHLYLPFIGFVELDTNECMGGTISVVYKVDVYTGTCLATVKITRSVDMPNSPILYTYSGNCSQQLPLTSGNATGVLSALIGGITAGLSVASGGGFGVVAGAQMAGNSLTHEMFHVQHSGNISANAGIMGNKKPYLVISRQHGYDANNYNMFYGYPANKTLYLGNQSGFVKVKKCFLQTSALKPEHDEILRLLQEGVIL